MYKNFSDTIYQILYKYFGDDASPIYTTSQLIGYLNKKTRSANRGSKSRGSYASIYSLYVIIEDYINKGFFYNTNLSYSEYEGASYSDLLKRQRELPFGRKLQNHALNNRTNSEFEKYFPETNLLPIIRDHTNNRYWINENLLIIRINNKTYNIAQAVIDIINEYIRHKQNSFNNFIIQCQRLQEIDENNLIQAEEFIRSLLRPETDARIFEIVSFSILKYHFLGQKIFWGYSPQTVSEEYLKLYKTGRTNANDGGIDFIMKPLGRIFQVTESLDFKKYFLDIDKIEKYPITFVIKSTDSIQSIRDLIRHDALNLYPVKAIVDKYLDCIEDIINIPLLIQFLSEAISRGQLNKIITEIILQSKVEFNHDEF